MNISQKYKSIALIAIQLLVKRSPIKVLRILSILTRSSSQKTNRVRQDQEQEAKLAGHSINRHSELLACDLVTWEPEAQRGEAN